MSAILFLGTKKPLSKTEFGRNDVFSDVKYPDSIFFRDGIAFDDDIFEANRRHIGHYDSECKWYEVKTVAMLFCFESKNKDAVPDLYEASLQLGEWFINFLSEQVESGNELYLLQRWLGDSPDRKINRRNLKISGLKPTDYKLPFDTLLKLSL